MDLTPPETREIIEALKACDSTLSDCNKANSAKQEVIDQQAKIIKEATEEAEKAKKDRDSLLHNPVLWFFVGVAVSGLAVGITAGALHR